MARRNTYIINKNYVNTGDGTVELPTIGAGTTSEMNAVTDVETGDFWLNSDTNTIWKYDGSAWIDTGFSLGNDVDLTNYQTPKLTNDSGAVINPLNIIDSDSKLIATMSYTGMHCKSPGYPIGSPGNGTIFIMPTGGSNQVKTALAISKTTAHVTYFRDTDTTVEWTQIGGSTVDLSNYQTPKLTADLGEMKVVLTSTLELIDAIKGGAGFYGVQNSLIPNGIVGKMIVLPFNQSGVYNAGIVITGDRGFIDNTYLVTVNPADDGLVWEELSVDLSNYQTPKLTGDDGMALQSVTSESDLVTLNVGEYYANQTLTQLVTGNSHVSALHIIAGAGLFKVAMLHDYIGGEMWMSFYSINNTTPPLTWTKVGASTFDLGTIPGGDNTIINLYGKAGTFTMSGNYPLVDDIRYGPLTGIISSPDSLTNESIVIVTDISGNTAVTSFNNIDTTLTWKKIGPYALLKNDGKNLQEVLNETTLFSLPPGFYDKGSYDIDGNSSSGMVHIFDYGNLSGYKKANAYFSNEIWTATFNNSSFSGGGWVKIAEPIVDAPGDLSTIDTLTTSSEFFDWIADSTFDSVFTPLYVYITGENAAIITGDSNDYFGVEMTPGAIPSCRVLRIYGINSGSAYTASVNTSNLSIETVFRLMSDMAYEPYSRSETVVSTDITAGVDIITPVTITTGERIKLISIELTGVLTSSTPNETITFELFVNDVSKGTITYDGGTNSTSNIYESNIHTVGSNDIIRVVATGSTTVAGFVKIKQV